MPPDGPSPERSGGRVTLAAGRVVLLAGVVLVGLSWVVRPAARQELAGIGLATVMGGLMIVLLGNYLRHAAGRAGPTGRAIPGGGSGAAGQPSSVPTTDTNDTISPG
jgi:hypothetical protein